MSRRRLRITATAAVLAMAAPVFAAEPASSSPAPGSPAAATASIKTQAKHFGEAVKQSSKEFGHRVAEGGREVGHTFRQWWNGARSGSGQSSKASTN